MTEPSTQPVAALSAFDRARAWLAARGKALSAWWSGSARLTIDWHLLAILLITAAMFGSIAYVAVRALTRGDGVAFEAEQPAVAQANPLTPLVDRLDALDDQVATLEDQVLELQRRQQPQASASGRSATPRPASSQSTQPSTAPERRRWGTTDLDREIDAFTQSLDTPTPLEPTK